MLVLFISSILILTTASILHQSIKIMEKTEKYENDYLEGSFAADYIADEIRSASEVYSIDEYTINISPYKPLDFILKIREDLFVTYAYYNDILYRVTSKNVEYFNTYPEKLSKNILSQGFSSIESSFDQENEVIGLVLHFGATEFIRLIPAKVSVATQ